MFIETEGTETGEERVKIKRKDGGYYSIPIDMTYGLAGKIVLLLYANIPKQVIIKRLQISASLYAGVLISKYRQERYVVEGLKIIPEGVESVAELHRQLLDYVQSKTIKVKDTNSKETKIKKSKGNKRVENVETLNTTKIEVEKKKKKGRTTSVPNSTSKDKTTGARTKKEKVVAVETKDETGTSTKQKKPQRSTIQVENDGLCVVGKEDTLAITIDSTVEENKNQKSKVNLEGSNSENTDVQKPQKLGFEIEEANTHISEDAGSVGCTLSETTQTTCVGALTLKEKKKIKCAISREILDMQDVLETALKTIPPLEYKSKLIGQIQLEMEKRVEKTLNALL